MKKRLVKAIALTAALSLATVNLSLASGGNIGHGDISIYENGSVISKLSGQNPVEDSTMMVCDGKCLVKSEGISLIANDKSQMAVSNETDIFNLYVKKGLVNYVINNNSRKIAFYTPEGSYTVAEVVFNADSGSVVKGNVAVASDGSTEISVTDGRMIFATADGMKAIDANNKLVLAQSSIPAGGAAGAAATSPGWIPWVVGGAAAFVAVALIIDSNDSDDNDVVLPPVISSPPELPEPAAPTRPVIRSPAS